MFRDITPVLGDPGLMSGITERFANDLEGLGWRPEAVAYMVGLYITAAYWFTASTSFANPAVTIARSLTDTFSGIYPAHAPGFILAQLVGAIVATLTIGWLVSRQPSK